MPSKRRRAVAVAFTGILVLLGAAILYFDGEPKTEAAAPPGGPSPRWRVGAPVSYQDLTLLSW
jgi:hypothetical protein